MSTQTQFVPAGYAQDAIAPYAVLTIPTKPDWDAISKDIQELDAMYDLMAEVDTERRQAEIRFPS